MSNSGDLFAMVDNTVEGQGIPPAVMDRDTARGAVKMLTVMGAISDYSFFKLVSVKVEDI